MPHFSETITVTELARNLASVIDRVRISSTKVSVTRGTQTVAEISPAVQPGITLRNLFDIRNANLGRIRKNYAIGLT